MKSQIWIAVAVYALVAIIRKELDIELSPYRMMQTISVTPFEQVSLCNYSGPFLTMCLVA